MRRTQKKHGDEIYQACPYLIVTYVDEFAATAVREGATILMMPADQSHGERQCRLRDLFGHGWLLGQKKEKLTHEQIQQRINKDFRQ